MLGIRKVVTVGGTFAAMIGVGFIMQSTSEKPVKAKQISQASAAELTREKTSVTGSQLELKKIVNTSALPTMPMDQTVESALPSAAIIKASTNGSDGGTFEQNRVSSDAVCEIKLDATSTTAAMVDLVLNAPCLPNERLTVHHNGMMFSETTGTDGMLKLQVAALAPAAVYIVSFSNGEGAVASTKVPSLEFYDRAVVQWRGASGIQLHAREFGANYGDDGHVWFGSEGDISAAATGTGGFMRRYGNSDLPEALTVEVYTFPSGTTQFNGDIKLSIETEVTALNCGKEIEAQTLQVAPDRQLKTQGLSLSVPTCDAVGDFLILNDMLDNLSIAQN